VNTIFNVKPSWSIARHVGALLGMLEHC